jgi:hypothetical protein
MAYERIEPFGERRQDWRMAVLASLLVNMVRGKDDKALTPAEFLEMIEADGEALDPRPEDLEDLDDEAYHRALKQ